jgi:hypothetical protein
MSDSKARDEWVQRVLGVATSGATPGTTGTAPGIAYRQLLLRWRAAQQALDENLKSLGASVLNHPDVKADPRYAEVELAVAALPKLVPSFGGALEDVLDAGLNTDDPAELARLAAQGVTAIDAYRQQLTAASRLLEMEKLVAKELGGGVALHGALDEALVELRQQLAA